MPFVILRRVFICIVATFCSLSLFAQQKAGRVVYERVVDIQGRIRISGAEGVNMPEMPKTITTQAELLFGEGKSLWQPLQDAAAGGGFDMGGEGGGNRMMRMGGNSETIFCALSDGRRLRQTEFLDREYLVEDTVKVMPWKMSTETKMILNQKVVKATSQRIGTRMQPKMENGEMKRESVADTAVIVAWFAPGVPVAAGPAEWGGQLPGLILEVNVNNGRQVYTAVELSPKVSLKDIKEPRSGKRMTAAQMAVERENLLKEMQQNSGGNMRIRVGQ